MIEVKNLTKIYGDNSNNPKALDNVSFTLPDKGLIFIIGKSGSGKSTLINMIGALDNATSGEVIVDNKDIIKMNQKELDLYRSQYLGIIYQNYNLFENETVIENIRIGLDLEPINYTEEESLKKINTLLDQIDLTSQKDKIVMNMSGGQKQRVAIARALIKNPQLILADEPTGNLDSKTTNIIFDLLKEISKDKLVLVISHDNKSALKYADRILEISDGKIYSDKVRNIKYHDEDSKNNKFINFYSDKIVEEKDINIINKRLEDTNYRVKNNEEKFIKTKDEDISFDSFTMNLKHSKFNLIRSFKTFKIFLKNSISSLIATVLISIFIISLLALSLSFSQFDGKSAVSALSEKYEKANVIFKKGFSFTNNKKHINKDYFIKLTDEDDEKLNTVYNGDLYYLYTVPVRIQNYNLDSGVSIGDSCFSGLYANSGIGVSVVDMKYLNSVYGDFDVIAGSLDNASDSMDLIVTDYFCDSLLYFIPELESDDPNDPYQKILNRDSFLLLLKEDIQLAL